MLLNNNLVSGQVARIRSEEELRELTRSSDFVQLDGNGDMIKCCGHFVRIMNDNTSVQKDMFHVHGMLRYTWNKQFAENSVFTKGDKVIVNTTGIISRHSHAVFDAIYNDYNRGIFYCEVVKSMDSYVLVKTITEGISFFIRTSDINFYELETIFDGTNEVEKLTMPDRKIRYINGDIVDENSHKIKDLNNSQKTVNTENLNDTFERIRLLNKNENTDCFKCYKIIDTDKYVFAYYDCDIERTYYWVWSEEEFNLYKRILELSYEYKKYLNGNFKTNEIVKVTDVGEIETLGSISIRNYDISDEELENFFGHEDFSPHGDKRYEIDALRMESDINYVGIKGIDGWFKEDLFEHSDDNVSPAYNERKIRDAQTRNKKIIVKLIDKIISPVTRDYLLYKFKENDRDIEYIYNNLGNSIYVDNINYIDDGLTISRDKIVLVLQTKGRENKAVQVPLAFISNVFVLENEIRTDDIVKINTNIPVISTEYLNDEETTGKVVIISNGNAYVSYMSPCGERTKQWIPLSYLKVIEQIVDDLCKINKAEVDVYNELAYTSVWSAIKRGVM